MKYQATLRIRSPYERAGEYRRPSVRRKALTKAEAQALREACTVPPIRWAEATLQRLPEPPSPTFRASIEQLHAKPGQLCQQVRPATPAAPPTVPTPVPAEDNPAPSVPRVSSPRPKTKLSDLAQATLERFRARYAL
ncbi:hypothetical protein Dolphis_90 [Pseudomonas phage Dolphis]|nr:hypothetical protein Dolphis_90 [Pseudomonas phage Dolphis]